MTVKLNSPEKRCHIFLTSILKDCAIPPKV
jgi:hypothetical protein